MGTPIDSLVLNPITPASTKIFFFAGKEVVFIDRAISISFQKSIRKLPVYDIDSTEYKFMGKGKKIITGQISLHYESTSYLVVKYLLSKYGASDLTISNTSLSDGLKNTNINEFSSAINELKKDSTFETLLQSLTSVERRILENVTNYQISGMSRSKKAHENITINDLDTSDLSILIAFNEANPSGGAAWDNSTNITIYDVNFLEMVTQVSIADSSPVIETYTFVGKL